MSAQSAAAEQLDYYDKQPVFRPEEISLLKEEAKDLHFEFDKQKSELKEEKVRRIVSKFKEITEGIPDIFQSEKEYLIEGIEQFERKIIETLEPLQSQISNIERELEALRSKLQEKELKNEQEIKEISQEIQKLEEQVDDLNSNLENIDRQITDLTSGRVPFTKRFKNLIPGRKKKNLSELQALASKYFNEREKLRKIVRKKKLEKYEIEDNFGNEKIGLLEKIEKIEKTLDENLKNLNDKLKKFIQELEDWIRRLIKDLEYLEEGGGLHKVEIISVDTKGRAMACVATARDKLDEYKDIYQNLETYQSSDEGLIALTADPGRKNQTSFEYLREEKRHDQPTLFYAGQILESPNDTVSREFVSCSLVEIFSPSSSRHVAFHLPPEWTEPPLRTANNLPYTPGFFYKKLAEFLKNEGCDYKDLRIKIVSGVSVPPDQIYASLKALGCLDENISLVQLPINYFTAMTLAKKQNILLLGKEVRFLEGDTKPPGQQAVYYTVGSKSKRGDRYITSKEKVQFVV